MDFVSYSDGRQRDWEGKVIGGDMPEALRLFIVPLKRDDEKIARMEEEVERLELQIRSALEELGVAPHYWAREAAVPPIEDPLVRASMLDDADLDRIIKL